MKKTMAILMAAIMVSALLSPISIVSGETGSPELEIDAGPIELTYDFDEPIVEKTVVDEHEYDLVSILGCDLYGAPEMPVLPFKTAFILIPYGEEVQDIQVIPGKEVYLGEFYIEPSQEPVPISFKGPIEPTLPNEEIYNSENVFPEEVYSKVAVQGMRGYQILILNLYPVRYLPKTKEVSYFESMKVIVNTRASRPDKLFRGLPQDGTQVAKIADNPEILISYDSAEVSSLQELTQPYQYVIITNEELAGASGLYNFQTLRDSKIAKGMTATIVTTEWIYAEYPGKDRQTRIRNFIIDAYKNWGTDYVLLGGDGDGENVGGESGDNIIPARGFWTGLKDDECEPPNIPADMYYSCLHGTFDFDGDGTYGEPKDGPGGGEVDLFAEVYVGRAPVDSETEVSNFVKKTLNYESSAFLGRALMVGEDLGWIPWGGDYKDEIKDGSSKWGYTTVGFPQPPFFVGTLYDRDWLPGHDWPKSAIINRLNRNPNLINHLGHANPTYVMKMFNSDVDALTNDKYFFGWTQGCYCGAFDNRYFEPWCNYISSDCILEHFVVDDHGAFAFIGNSRYGWGSSSNTNGPSQRFDREFWDAVFGEAITRIGIANADSKEDNAGLIGDSYIRFCYYEINLFGDPEISIKTPTVSIYTDKTSYTTGDTMHVGLDVTNPGDALPVRFVIWLKKPSGGIKVVTDRSLTLPAGLDYSNPNYMEFTLPGLPPGTYTWHAALIEPSGPVVFISHDTASWEFGPAVAGAPTEDVSGVLEQTAIAIDFGE